MPPPSRKNKLERRYGLRHLHFITCSCYRRLPFFASERRRNIFLKILSEVRDRHDFALFGYVVMPEHIHLLISEPSIGTPSLVMQVLKQRVLRALRRRRWNSSSPGQMRLWNEEAPSKYPRFWQRRFYDFNVWSSHKKNEKLNYMHFNPVRRGLVDHPKSWPWSSYRHYVIGGPVLCPPNPEWKPASPKAVKRKERTPTIQDVRHPASLRGGRNGSVVHHFQQQLRFCSGESDAAVSRGYVALEYNATGGSSRRMCHPPKRFATTHTNFRTARSM